MKIQDPHLRDEELERVLKFDAALHHFFEVRRLSMNIQEAFQVMVKSSLNRVSGVSEAIFVLDGEHDSKVPRYLAEEPIDVQARVILLSHPTKPHEGELRRAAVVLRAAAVWYEIKKAAGATEVSETFAQHLKDKLRTVPRAHLTDSGKCVEIIGCVIGWDDAYMRLSGVSITGRIRSSMHRESLRNLSDGEYIKRQKMEMMHSEALRESARQVIEGREG